MQQSASTIFGWLRDPLWAYAQAGGARRVIEAGQLLFDTGDRARDVFFVVSGALEVFRRDGRWRVMWTRAAGDAVSFDCGGRRELSCRTAQRTELIAVDGRILRRAAKHSRALEQRLRALHESELKLMLSTLGDNSGMRSRDVIDMASFVRRAAERRREPAAGPREKNWGGVVIGPGRGRRRALP